MEGGGGGGPSHLPLSLHFGDMGGHGGTWGGQGLRLPRLRLQQGPSPRLARVCGAPELCLRHHLRLLLRLGTGQRHGFVQKSSSLMSLITDPDCGSPVSSSPPSTHLAIFDAHPGPFCFVYLCLCVASGFALCPSPVRLKRRPADRPPARPLIYLSTHPFRSE